MFLGEEQFQVLKLDNLKSYAYFIHSYVNSRYLSLKSVLYLYSYTESISLILEGHYSSFFKDN